MTRIIVLALTAWLAAILLASPMLACSTAGPNTHLGVVTAVDSAKSTITLKDAETGKNLTFRASPEQLKGIAVKDDVTIVYAAEGKDLRATSIKKG